MASSKNVAERIANAKRRSAKLLARGSKIEARLAGPKTKLDLVVATMADLALKRAKLKAKGGPNVGEKIAKLDKRSGKLAKRRAKLEKRVGPILARLEKVKGGLAKNAATIQRAGG